MSYIGRGLQSGAFRQLDDISSGFDGSDTTHTMRVNSTNVTVGDVNQILLSLGGVIQKPGTDFTVSSSTLTFTTAPAANTSFFAILLGSDNGGTVTPTDGSVTTAKIVDDAVTGAKLADDIAITTTGNVSVDGGSFTFNESGASVDLRAETDSQTHALFIDGSANAIGLFNSAPSFTADTGMHLADDVKIGFGTGGSSRPDFQLNADSSNLKLACGFGADTADINISTGAAISTGQETAPDVDGNGLCLNQLVMLHTEEQVMLKQILLRNSLKLNHRVDYLLRLTMELVVLIHFILQRELREKIPLKAHQHRARLTLPTE